MELLNNRYRTLNVIGQGGMGRVYLGIDMNTERNVAIKECLVERQNFAIRVERIQREYYFMVHISHPNVVRAYDFFSHGSKYFIVMEYVDGISFLDFIRDHTKSLNFQQKLNIAKQICSAVIAINSKGIIHRDLKPSNIIVQTNTYVPKILDLGIAKSINNDMDLSTLTKTGNILGTPEYMSPEQLDGKVEQNSDVFSLGVLLYQFFSCMYYSPFYGGNMASSIDKIVSLQIPQLANYLQTEDPDYINMSKILNLSLQKDPARRIASTNEMLYMLENINDPHAIKAKVPETMVLADEDISKIKNLSKKRTGRYLAKTQKQATSINFAKINPIISFVKTNKLLMVSILLNISLGLLLTNIYFKYSGKIAENCYKIAILHREKGDYPRALRNFERSLRFKSPNVFFYLERAKIYKLQDEYEKALEEYNMALSLEPQNYAIYLERANLYSKIKLHDKAINDYNKAVAIASHIDKPYLLRAEFNQKLGKYEKAIEDYNKAIEIAKKPDEAYFSRANFYYFREQFERAIEDYSQAIKWNDKLVHAYFFRGISFYKLKKYNEAIADYNKVIDEEPTYSDAYNNRAASYDLVGEYLKALADYNKAIELKPTFLLYYNRGNFYKNNNNMQKAFDDYSKSIDLNDKYSAAYEARGNIYKMLGDFDKAKNDFEKAEELKTQEEK